MVLKDLLRLRSVAQESIQQVLINFIDDLLKDMTLFKKTLSKFCVRLLLYKIYILGALQTLSVKGEFDKLQKPQVNGLGTPEHQRLLRNCINDMLKSYLEILCIFCYNCSKENQAQCLELLFNTMRKIPLEEEQGHLSISSLSVWTALLIFINPIKLKHTENLSQILKIFKDNLYYKWENPAACASIAWCFSVAVKCARNLPGGFRNEFEIDESKLVDAALDNCAFQFLRTCILDVPDFHEMEICVDVMDSFLKSFLSYFPEKAQELLNVCEEEIMRLAPLDDEVKKPRMYYLKFLAVVTKTYSVDTPKIRGLCEQFTMSNYVSFYKYMDIICN